MKVIMHSSSSNSSEDSSSPTRPLTAYHLFFQLEREFILQTTRGDVNGDDAPTTKKDDDHRPLGKDLDVDMPFRYRYIHLSPEWCISGKLKKKRIHRKTHGKISFQDLSTTIASRWKELETIDNSTYLYVRKVAARELSKYREIKKANATAALYKMASTSVINMKNNSKVEQQQLLFGNELKSSSSSCGASSGINVMMTNARSSPVLSGGGSANSEQRRVRHHSSIGTITSSSSSYTNTHRPTGVVQRGASFFTSGAKRNSFINDAFVSSGGNYMQQQQQQQQQRHSCPPTYDYHYNHQLKELQSDINAFMTRMGPRFMEEEQSSQTADNKADEVNMKMITPTDDIKPTDYNRKASVELSLDDAMELYKALSSDDGEQTTPMYSQSVRRASAA